jgi:hypothetical protein
MAKQIDHKTFARLARRFLAADRHATQVAELVQAGRALDEDYQIALAQARMAAEAIQRSSRKG